MRARHTITCLAIVLLAAASRGDELCGMTFKRPSGWDAELKESEPHRCAIGLRPRGWQKLRDESEFLIPRHAITVTVSEEPTDVIARDAGFIRVGDLRVESPDAWRPLADDAWLVWGKGFSEAQPVKGKTWAGVMGEAVVWAGFRDKDRGGHTSGLEFRALLIEKATSRRRTAYIFCNTRDCETLLPVLLQSVNFVPVR